MFEDEEKELTPDEKIWQVLKAIDDANALAPTEDMALVDVRKLEKQMLRIEHEQIFEKMQRQWKVIEIGITPDYKDNFEVRIRILNKDRYREFINFTHNKIFGGIDRLSQDNFLSVVDVCRDITEALQMTAGDDVQIPLLPQIVRFPVLMPHDDVGFRDRYCELRTTALDYLKNNGHIDEFQVETDVYVHRWEYKISIFLNRLKMDKFYTDLIKKYEVRVWKPLQEEQKNNESTEKTQTPIKTKPIGELKTEHKFDKLVAYNDGTIRYGEIILKMRPQIKELCWYFMGNPNRLITYDDLKQNIIRADKRLETSNSTISKYVNELRKILKVHLKKDAVPSQNEEGYYFKP